METVVAIFVITFAILIMAALFRTALEGAKRARKVTVANVLANKRMEEIIYWAGEGTNFTNWVAIDGVSGPDAQFPDFTVRSDTEAYLIYSPCSESETRFPADQRRTLAASARKIRVRVTWSPTTDARNKVDLISVVGAPAQKLASVQIDGPDPSPLAALSNATLTAGARDPGGQNITDLFYHWNLSPLTGYGSITPSRDGRQLILSNRVYNPDTGGWQTVSGNVSLDLKSTSMGLTRETAKEIYLAP